MEKFIPYEKLSKKKRRELDKLKRGSWGGLNPVTRTPKNPKAYDRRKAQNWKKESGSAPYVIRCLLISSLQPSRRVRPRRIQRRSPGPRLSRSQRSM